MLLISVFWALPIWAGALVGSSKGRAGWAWGLFLGWLGVLIVALLPNETSQHVAEKQTQLAGSEADVQVLEIRNREAS